MRIRPAMLDDVTAVATMMVEFETHLAAIEGKKKSFAMQGFAKALRKAMAHQPPLAHVLMAEEGRKPLGYVLYCPAFNASRRKPVIYVQDLFVRRAVRAKGTGRKLMLEMRKIARKLGCGSIAWTVWNRNPRALAFYLGLGAEPIEDEIMLEWKVK
ncbi:MAG: GNAT family N-acetyltransferase [Proteobacteria bacterium]|nr:GNAT family N-acetyltransferase [Pseudomonadota bacterium]